MYRPSFRNLFSSQQYSLPDVEDSTLPGIQEQQLIHVEALYEATEEELMAAQSLDFKMEELEQALGETRELVQVLKDEVTATDEQRFVVDLVRLKEAEVDEIENEVDQKRAILEAATRRTNELAGEALHVQFDTDLAFIH
jgi:archaellum component FlaC